MVPDDRKYTDEHEWIRLEGDVATVGITEYAAHELGDVVFVELPEVGSEFSQGDNAGTIESVKAVGDLYQPLSGEIIAVNEAVVDNPELVNTSPMEDGWLIQIKVADTEELTGLMDAAAYSELTGG